MSKNDMKLIMEGWRQSLKEMNAVQTGGVQTGAVTKKEEINEEELDEGLKEIGLIAGLMSLIGVGDASAGGIERYTYGSNITHENVVDMNTVLKGAIENNPNSPNIEAYKDAQEALEYIATEVPEDKMVTQGEISTFASVPELRVGSKGIDVINDLAEKVQAVDKEAPSQSSGIPGDTNNDGQLSPIELSRMQSDSSLTQQQKDKAKDAMQRIQQQKTNESAI